MCRLPIVSHISLSCWHKYGDRSVFILTHSRSHSVQIWLGIFAHFAPAYVNRWLNKQTTHTPNRHKSKSYWMASHIHTQPHISHDTIYDWQVCKMLFVIHLGKYISISFIHYSYDDKHTFYIKYCKVRYFDDKTVADSLPVFFSRKMRNTVCDWIVDSWL